MSSMYSVCNSFLFFLCYVSSDYISFEYSFMTFNLVIKIWSCILCHCFLIFLIIHF